MAKGFYIYDPNTKEFRTRHAGRPWALDDTSAIATMDAAGAGAQEAGEGGMPPVDRTPIRSGPRELRPAVYDDAAPPESEAWRWIMWVLIAVMAVTWLVMIGKQVLQTRESVQQERIFEYGEGSAAPK